MAAIFALVGWPFVARGVRGIVAVRARARICARGALARRQRLAAFSAATCCRPARGYLLVQATLLLPAFILAEATLSYVGLGFPESTCPTWGTMLIDAANVNALTRFPWTLAPAVAIFSSSSAPTSILQSDKISPHELAEARRRGDDSSGWHLDSNCNSIQGHHACRIASPASTRPSSRRSPPTASIDERGIAHNVDRYLTSPLTGLVVLGSNGEAAQLEDDEADRAIAIVRERVPRDRPLLAGTGRESTRATIAACRRAAALGVDAVMARTPSFYKPQMTSDGFVRHYTEVADASPVPVLLYNVTMYTGVNLLPDAVEKLSEHPNIVGLKDSGNDMLQIARLPVAIEAGLHGAGWCGADALHGRGARRPRRRARARRYRARVVRRARSST